MAITITGAMLFIIALAIYRLTVTDWAIQRLSKNGVVQGTFNAIFVTLISIALGVLGLLVLFVGLVSKSCFIQTAKPIGDPTKTLEGSLFFTKILT